MPRILAFLVACACAAPLAAQAPALNASDPAVTLVLSPTELPTNGTVKISGMAYPQPGVQVHVTVTPPSGGPSVLVAPQDKNGNYAITFGSTKSQGLYKVSAQAGAKSGPALAEFNVHTYLIDIDDAVADNKSFLEDMDKLVTAVKKEVDGVPDSPAKTEMETKLDALDQAEKPIADQTTHLAAALAPFKTMVTQQPDAEETLQPMFDHLSQLDDQMKKSKVELDQEIEESQKGSQTCDAIDHATAALKAVPDMIGIAKKPWQFAAAFGTNMAKSELPEKAGPGADAIGGLVKNLPGAAGKPTESLAENEMELGSETEIAEKMVERIPASVRQTPGYKFAVEESKKFVPSIVEGTKSPIEMFDKATTLAGAVVAYANEQLFGKYCEKFEGDFTATMLAHFYSKANGDGKPTEWWTYSTAVKGKITLRYPKGASGKAVALSGQLEGGATRFTYKSNVFTSSLFGSNMFGAGEYLTKDVAPAATDNATGGMVNSLISPTSFYIPLTGQLDGGKMTITLGDARSDFNETYTQGHTFFVVIAQRTLGLPMMGHFTLPYVKAAFILNQVVKGDYDVETKGNTMMVEKTATRERPANQNLAVYTIEMKACNPGCE
jgi:hypothetical protein